MANLGHCNVLHRVAVMALVSLTTAIGGCETRPVDSRLAGIDEYAVSALADWDMPGMAVAIVHGDKVLFADGFGVKQLGQSEEIDGETLFQIGSTSKAFGAAAVAALVDEEKLTWDDKVLDHVPWFETPEDEITKNATVRELLAHTSGIGGDIGTSVMIMSPEEAGRRLALPGTTQPTRGTRLYSNSGYGVTQLVVEAASGISWKAHVEEKIFTPLKMHDSATTPYDVWDDEYVAPAFLGSAPAGEVGLDDASQFNVAIPHGYDRQGNRRKLSWQSYDALAPAGNIVSNAKDLGQWLRLWLNKGLVDGKQILSAEVIGEMTSHQSGPEPGYFLFADNPEEAPYGLGWSRQTFQGRDIVYHGGGIFGFPAFIAFFPNDGLGVAVVANGSTLSPYYPHQDIVAWVAQRLLALESRDWRKELLEATKTYSAALQQREAQLQAERRSEITPTLNLEAYVGEYESVDLGKALGRSYVELVNGELQFRLEKPGEFSGVFEHWQEDQFRLHYRGGDGVAWANVMGSFDVKDGRVETLELELLGSFARVE